MTHEMGWTLDPWLILILIKGDKLKKITNKWFTKPDLGHCVTDKHTYVIVIIKTYVFNKYAAGKFFTGKTMGRQVFKLNWFNTQFNEFWNAIRNFKKRKLFPENIIEVTSSWYLHSLAKWLEMQTYRKQ